MAQTDDSAKQIVIALMKDAVPERLAELNALWTKYNPTVKILNASGAISLRANKDSIEFDTNTMNAFWLIGFGGWKAIECYSPLVICSTATGIPLADLINRDEGLQDVERSYKERLAAVQNLIKAKSNTAAPWPPDLPRPGVDRNAFSDPQFKVAFDLTSLAIAFALFHEFHHVMLYRDGNRHNDLREEEMSCDVWGRTFMTAKLAAYAQPNGREYRQVLRIRSMGLALAALILHEITPALEHGGNKSYFAVSDRLKALLDNTPLPSDDHFWVFAASLLIGIYRQKQIRFDDSARNAAEMARCLLAGL